MTSLDYLTTAHRAAHTGHCTAGTFHATPAALTSDGADVGQAAGEGLHGHHTVLRAGGRGGGRERESVTVAQRQGPRPSQRQDPRQRYR